MVQSLVQAIAALCVGSRGQGSSMTAAPTNAYPIVLVHGLGGWGPSEFFGLKYWGTLQGDLVAQLRARGHTVFTASVGKVSSNWDRACELFAQIKGGRVDYGANHARTHGHARFGRTFAGFVPHWGTTVDGRLQKVHLIGHSMGGQTIRMLTQLLNHGTHGAATEAEDPASHELFAGGHDWVHSVTTLAAPNQGSTLADAVSDSLDSIQNTIAVTYGIAGLLGTTATKVYDLHLDQWGIKPKEPDESLFAYIGRIAASNVFSEGFVDNAGYSLSTDGARAENAWVRTLPNVFYYSFVLDATITTSDTDNQLIAIPDKFIMSPLMYSFAGLMGSRRTIDMGFTVDWLPNDGLVNVVSQISDGQAAVVDYANRPELGVWMSFKTLCMDHVGLLGTNPLLRIFRLYDDHAMVLAQLPSHESVASHRELHAVD